MTAGLQVALAGCPRRSPARIGVTVSICRDRCVAAEGWLGCAEVGFRKM